MSEDLWKKNAIGYYHPEITGFFKTKPSKKMTQDIIKSNIISNAKGIVKGHEDAMKPFVSLFKSMGFLHSDETNFEELEQRIYDVDSKVHYLESDIKNA